METVFEFLAFLVQVIFWWLIFSIPMNIWMRKSQKKQEELESTISKLGALVHRVEVEQHGDTYYWFDADDGSFLGQGKNTEETIDHIKYRFPNHVFLVRSKETDYKITAPNWMLEPIKISS